MTREGEGTSWSAQTSDGEIHTYIINGIRPLEEIEEDFATAYLWLWNLKDYIKELAIQKSLSADWIENQINADKEIVLSGDIANLIKHGRLNRSRSGKHPKLKRLKITLPQTSLGTMTFRSHEVEVDTMKLDGATLAFIITWLLFFITSKCATNRLGYSGDSFVWSLR